MDSSHLIEIQNKSGDQFFPRKPEIDAKLARRTQRATSSRKPIARVGSIGHMGEPRGPLPVVGAFGLCPRVQLPASGFGVLNSLFSAQRPRGGEGRPGDPDGGR